MSKREKSLHEKMKNFFGRRDTTPINFESMRVEPHVVSRETIKDISSENNVNHRLKALGDLCEHVTTKRLADNAVEAICKHIEDLLGAHHSTETRHTVFQFYCILINGQLEYMSIMRSYLFRLVVCHSIPEDLISRLDMIKALSNDGKTIINFEEEMGPFLLEWLPDFRNAGRVAVFLSLITNVIKFNAAYLDDYIIDGFVRNILSICCQTKTDEDIQECLNILEAILCYSHLPGNVLHFFICALCVTVNKEKFVACSWKQMRNLLGTNIGHTALLGLLQLLQDVFKHPNASLVRGAVFFVGMALWGSNRVSSLTHPPTTILPSFLKALDRNEEVIAYEIVLALKKLVVECEDQLINRSLIWDRIFEIIERILAYPAFRNSLAPASALSRAVQDFISVTQTKCPEDSHEYLYKIIDQCSSFINEKLVVELILYKEENLKWYKPEFFETLNQLLEKFFKNEKRSAVQLEVVKVTRRVREMNMRFFEEDAINHVILQNASQSDVVPDVEVRKEMMLLLIAMCDTNNGQLFFEVLEIIEKIMKHTFNDSSEKHCQGDDQSKVSHSDILAAVDGLTSVFRKKLLFMPSNHCIEVFNLLVKNLHQQYQFLHYTKDIVKIRKLILGFFFQLRANKYKQIGIHLPEDSERIEGAEGNQQTKYSVYILLNSDESKGPNDLAPSSPPPGSPSAIATTSFLKFDQAYQVIIMCLKEEKDWGVLESVLRQIPLLLQNKSLILKGNCSVASLCLSLCSLINDRKHALPDSLKNAPVNLTRTDVHGHVYPCLAALTSYHSNLESHVQRILIKSLQSGLVSRSAKICMEGLTLCILEMQNSMVKLLPDVLLKLSKISATKTVAVSVLEFLSNLIRLPHLYISFVEDQYMSIFAIALPYTNPFKFNQYTVALAHHVLSMWFLKCRIPFRKDFARFITKGLRNNLNVPREENQGRTDEEGKSKELHTDAILALHTELMETGLDLMARFTFGMCTNVPQRSPVAEFLLEKGQKTSWLVGNKIVTITTSGCGTKTFKHGLCERCYTSSHEMSKSIESNESVFLDSELPLSSSEKFQAQRKRHRSAIQRTNTPLTKDELAGANQTKDDITLHYQRFHEPDLSMRRHTSYVPDTERLSKAALEAAESKEKGEQGSHLCSCWCTSWAEVHIRRPTGNTSWMMRIQNQLFLPSAPPDVPLSVLSSLLLPQRAEITDQDSQQLSFDNDSLILNESEFQEMPYEGAIDICSSQKTNPPMRRTNSSPDMNTGWLLSLEKESQFATLEGYPELKRDERESDAPLEESKSISFSTEGQTEKTKPKSLKLELTSIKDRSASVESRLPNDREIINSAPIDKRLYNNEVQQQPGSFRDRGHTISVMSPSRPTGSDNSVKGPEMNQRSGMSPSFVFLQLFHNSIFGPATHKPLLLQQTEANHRALTVLDHIPPYDTHKIGIVYVGPGQADSEVSILSNVYGSARYVAFLRGLGNIVELTDTDPHTTYLGGLDTRGEDGQFGLIWHDDVMQVVFHVATFMLDKESDKNRNEKKKHIANDSVIIVYNESGDEFKISTIKGHVTNAWVVIKPEDFNCNIVSVKHKTEELAKTFGHTESYVVSDASLPVFVRQMALHANLASLIISRRQQSAKDAHVSNWLERLRTIKRLRSKVLEELRNKNTSENYGFESANDTADYDNFTDYV